MTRHFLFVAITLTQLIPLEEIVAIVTELPCWVAFWLVAWEPSGKNITFTKHPSEGHTSVSLTKQVALHSTKEVDSDLCICLVFVSFSLIIFLVLALGNYKPRMCSIRTDSVATR